LQVYFNGHNLLSSLLKKAGVKHTMIDNAFETMSDAVKAQELADQFSVEQLHRRLELFAWQYCPVYKKFKSRYHWSIMQAEYSTDIVFKTQTALAPLYSELVSTAIHTVKPDNIATFFGQKLDRSRYTGEIGNTYNVRTEGSRIKHTIGCASIKIYDKFGKILRIEATTNNVSFFKHYREVEHRDGTTSNQIAPLKKNIYSLAFLSEILKSSNRRYIEFISEFDSKKICSNRTIHRHRRWLYARFVASPPQIFKAINRHSQLDITTAKGGGFLRTNKIRERSIKRKPSPHSIVGYLGFPLTIRGNDKKRKMSFPNVSIGNLPFD
jgi:hypothetical protein